MVSVHHKWGETPMSEQATYIVRDNEIVYPPPYQQADTCLMAWMVPSPREKQKAILDAQLNACSGGHPYEYRPLLSQAMIVLANIEKVSSLDPSSAELGWIPEVDVCTWILCGAYKLVDGKLELDHLAWYLPYIWVNNADTMANGREVFGYPKALCWAKVPVTPKDPGPFWADALVIPEGVGPQEVVRKRVLELTPAPGLNDPPPLCFDEGQKVQAFREIAKRLHEAGQADCDLNFFLETFLELIGGHVPMVFLKQFRSVTSSHGACYQAIVEANATINAFRGAGISLSAWNLTLPKYASVDIAGNLLTTPIPRIEWSFHIQFSFSMDLGQEVWRFGGK
jgi:hypothetical protein